MTRRKGLALAAFLLLGTTLTACDSGPKCLHHTTQVVTSTSIVSTGKTVIPVTSTHLVTVCDKYAPEVAK